MNEGFRAHGRDPDSFRVNIYMVFTCVIRPAFHCAQVPFSVRVFLVGEQFLFHHPGEDGAGEIIGMLVDVTSVHQPGGVPDVNPVPSCFRVSGEFDANETVWMLYYFHVTPQGVEPCFPA